MNTKLVLGGLHQGTQEKIALIWIEGKKLSVYFTRSGGGVTHQFIRSIYYKVYWSKYSEKCAYGHIARLFMLVVLYNLLSSCSGKPVISLLVKYNVLVRTLVPRQSSVSYRLINFVSMPIEMSKCNSPSPGNIDFPVLPAFWL